ncbi:MAG TPA: hypothetical protein VGB79_04515 [Allosphingosinicella sp.]
MSGQHRVEVPLVSFGEHATSLSASIDFSRPRSTGEDSNRIISAMISPHAFQLSGFNAEPGNYSTLVFPSGSGYFYSTSPTARHINPDGSWYRTSFGPTHVTEFSSPSASLSGFYDSEGTRMTFGPWSNTLVDKRLADTIVFANGEQWTFFRQRAYIAASGQIPGWWVTRLRSVVSSRGYAIQYLYITDAAPTNASSLDWQSPTQVTPYNKGYVFCDESQLQPCPAVSALPSTLITRAGNTVSISRPGMAGALQLTFGAGLSIGHTAVPGSAVTYYYGMDNRSGYETPHVSRVVNADGTWNYEYWHDTPEGHFEGVSHGIATGPLNWRMHVVGSTRFGQPTTIYQPPLDTPGTATDIGLGTQLQQFRVLGQTEPGGIIHEVARDDRNNVTSVVRHPRPGSSEQPITVQTAIYPLHCENPRTCNRPTSTTDANNNTTDFTYAPEHGGLLTETGPALNGVRPQKRYEYAQRHAWISNGSGGYMQVPAPVWLLVRERYCRTTAAAGSSCAGGAGDEVVADYDYGPDVGPNTLLLRGTAVTAGGQTLRTCYGYDTAGNRISVTDPSAGLTSCP